jgi:hypothetical protein
MLTAPTVAITFVVAFATPNSTVTILSVIVIDCTNGISELSPGNCKWQSTIRSLRNKLPASSKHVLVSSSGYFRPACKSYQF